MNVGRFLLQLKFFHKIMLFAGSSKERKLRLEVPKQSRDKCASN